MCSHIVKLLEATYAIRCFVVLRLVLGNKGSLEAFVLTCQDGADAHVRAGRQRLSVTWGLQQLG